MLMANRVNFKALFRLDRMPFLCDKSFLAVKQVGKM